MCLSKTNPSYSRVVEEIPSVNVFRESGVVTRTQRACVILCMHFFIVSEYNSSKYSPHDWQVFCSAQDINKMHFNSPKQRKDRKLESCVEVEATCDDSEQTQTCQDSR